MSGEELAQKVGYKTQSGISNLENRATGHGGNKIALIAQALNVSVHWLLSGPDTDDMRTVAPFQAPAASVTPTGTYPSAQDAQQSQYATVRMQAHALIDSTSDKGLLSVMEVLEMIAERHPRSEDGAGVHLPARRAGSM